MNNLKKHTLFVASALGLFVAYNAQGMSEIPKQPKRAAWQDTTDDHGTAPDIIKALIKAKVNGKLDLNEHADDGDTLIHVLCADLVIKRITELEAQQSLELLVEAGVRLDAQDADGESAFAYMAETLSSRTFAYFLQTYFLSLSEDDVIAILNNTDIPDENKWQVEAYFPKIRLEFKKDDEGKRDEK